MTSGKLTDNAATVIIGERVGLGCDKAFIPWFFWTLL